MASFTPAQALAHASVPILLMCLTQITGDERWLTHRYRPKRDRRLFHDESGGLDEATQYEVRHAMDRVLHELQTGARTLAPSLDEERLAEMMRVCVADEVSPEYVPMLMEELQFRQRDVHWTSAAPPPQAVEFRVLIVGAGMSGICAAVKLEQLGVPWTLIERNQDVGGVWVENSYPDAGVDTPNQFYSYSFEPSAEWTSYFSKRDEVLAYFRGVADRHRIRSRIRFETEVTTLRWDEVSRRWEATLRTPQGKTERLVANAVVCAVGQMNQPRTPEFPGLSRFTGPAFHSARWRHDVEIAGKRVAVIGAGASAMQLLRPVAARAAHVTLFQRSPQWVLPIPDYHRKVSDETRWLLENVPYYRAWYRFGLFWRFSDGILKTLRKDPQWPHPERAVNAANDRNRELMTEYLKMKLEGRDDLIRKLLPDYPPYGKRILIDNQWFDTVRRDNVEVVDAGIERVEEDAIVDAHGCRHPVDVIVLATGFEAGKMLHSMHIVGKAGEVLADRWGDDDPRAYLGITVPGFPNLFCMYGPNSNLGHGGSAIFQAECQIRYITGCLVRMIEDGVDAIDVRRDVHDDYNARVDAEHASLVWSHPGMTNWYRNARGRVFSIMPWRMVDFWRMTHDPDLAEYELVGSTGR